MSKDLLVKGGTIVFDNAFMGGHAYNPESTNEHGLAIRKCNEYLKSRDDIFRVSKTIHSMKKFSSFDIKNYLRKVSNLFGCYNFHQLALYTNIANSFTVVI
jgi:hypothetical protein